MSNSDIILEYLEENAPGGYCDDCISGQLGIEPRQQVNQICRRLMQRGAISRNDGVCASCGGSKIVNASKMAPPQTVDRTGLRDASAVYAVHSVHLELPIDIERLRTQVVRMCHAVWQKEKAGEKAPLSISAIISNLKEDDLLPRHPANMMLTLCNLRNVYVYEEVELGPSELDVARGAWAIISRWWESARDR